MSDPDIIVYRSNFYKPLIDKAIALTEKYVSENKLILTGGMAIDMALRTKGLAIYDDDTIPDYDIISDKNLDHANALAEILCKENLPDVNVINAVHVTTVRVRLKNITLLDATYIPPKCFEKIPYLDVDHLRIVHPHYQLIDQRLSLSHLMMDTGLSLNIFNRLKKDMDRNALLRDNFPILIDAKTPTYKTVSIPLDLIRVDAVTGDGNSGNESFIDKISKDVIIYTGPMCIAGAVGHVLMLSQHGNKKAFKVTEKDGMAMLDVTIPQDCVTRYLTCDIESAVSKMSNAPRSKHRPLINLKPASVRGENYELVDTYGARVSCNIIEIANDIRVCVASVDYLLMECLRDRIYVDNNLYTSMYQELITVTVKEQQSLESSAVWWPSVNAYGKVNLPEHRVFMIEKMMDPTATASLKPKNSYLMYPKCFTRSKDFDQSASHYFQIDGSEDDKLEHTNHKHIMDEFKTYVEKQKQVHHGANE